MMLLFDENNLKTKFYYVEFMNIADLLNSKYLNKKCSKFILC